MQSNRFPFPGASSRDAPGQQHSSNFSSSNARWPPNVFWKSRSETTDMWPSSASPWANNADNSATARQASASPSPVRGSEAVPSLHELANSTSSTSSFLAAIGPSGTYAKPRPKPIAASADASTSSFKYTSSLRDSVTDEGSEANSTPSPYASFGLLDTDALATRVRPPQDLPGGAFASASAAASATSSTFSASAAPGSAAVSTTAVPGGTTGLSSYGSFGTLASSQHGHAHRSSLQTTTSFSSPGPSASTIPYQRNSQPEDVNTFDVALKIRQISLERSPDTTPNALASNGYSTAIPSYPPSSSSAVPPFQFDPGSQPWNHAGGGGSGYDAFVQGHQNDLDVSDGAAAYSTHGGLDTLDQRPVHLTSSYRQDNSPQNLNTPTESTASWNRPPSRDPRVFSMGDNAGRGGLSQRQPLQNYIQEQQLAAALFNGNPGFFQPNLAAIYNGYRGPIPMPSLGMSMHPSLNAPFLGAPHIQMSRDKDPTQSMRSPLLDEFRSSRTNRRYELKDIYNHIVEFSGDQHGSRFIQSKLEAANSDEKEHVFREISANTLVLMKDVFGNYVVQKFFEHGNQVQKKYLAEQMRGKMVDLSTQTYACRVVQKALQHILLDQQIVLAMELETDVIRVIKDQNGNHVIQKVIELIPREHVGFIMDAFHGQVRELAAHNFGCRVVQRMLEYGSKEDKAAILSELHASTKELIMDQFGNYVAQHVIQFGEPDDRAKIINKVVEELVPMSRHKFASNVVEKCIENGTVDDRRQIRSELEKDAGNGKLVMDQLIKDQYGNYVIQKLLKQLKNEEHQNFVELLSSRLVALKDSSRQNGAIERLAVVVGELARDDEHTPTGRKHHGLDDGRSGSASPVSAKSHLQGDNESTPSLSLTSLPNTPESSKPPSVGTGPTGDTLSVKTEDGSTMLGLGDSCEKQARSTSHPAVAMA